MTSLDDKLKGNEVLLNSFKEEEKRYVRLQEEVKISEQKWSNYRTQVVDLYKKLEITPEECDHPVQGFSGLTYNECVCCGKHFDL